MDTNKLEISTPKNDHSPNATYKQIPEDDMEDQALSRPKSLLKADSNKNEPDGANEKMLPNDEKKIGSNSNINIVEVKFTSNDKQNGDAKLDISEVKSEFVGLTKEELMKYANDPFWVRLRWFLFVLFWLLWAGMLLGAILIIVAAPKCAPPEPKTWWEEGPLTEADTLATETDLDTLKANGFSGLIVPYPYDTYKPLNETDSFLQFLKLAQNKNLKFIVDLKPAVSKIWFERSEAKDEEFDNYYIWGGHEGVEEEAKQLPNNWLAKNSTDDKTIPAWKYSKARKQYYLAPTSEPQLNFRLQKVVDLFSNVITSFLDAGVDGIRLRGAPNLLVDADLADEAFTSKPADFQQGNYNFFTHAKTENVEGLNSILMEWRDIVKNKTGNAPFMLAEDLPILDPYKVNDTLVIDLPKHTGVFTENALTATKLYKGIEAALKLVGTSWPIWEVKTTDLPLGVLETVAFLMKGTSVIDRNFKIEQELIDTRKSPSIMYGSQTFHLVANDTVFVYIRVHAGNPGFIVALNPSNEHVILDFPSEVPEVTPEVTVQYLSRNYNETDISKRKKTDASIFPMPPKTSVVLSYVPKDEKK